MRENRYIEFKSSFNDATIESLVAFANTKGGKVYIGVDAKGIPLSGFKIGEETLQQWLNQIKVKTQPAIVPDVNFKKLKGTIIVELYIPEFPIKPVSFKGRYYKRVENSNHQLSLQEISNFHLQTFNNSWDNYFTNTHTLTTISFDKVTAFIKSMEKVRQIPLSDDPLTVLYKYELIKDDKISNACGLLFGNKDIFSAAIELGRFSSPDLIKDGMTSRSDLFNQVEEVLSFVRKHTNKEFIITGQAQREERWQYPPEAIREIVINMIVHRDYRHYGDSTVKMFDDYIEFFNPGALPEDLSVEQLLSGRYVSQSRNKKIAAMFKEAGLIEKYGSGIRRIRNAFIAYGLKEPVFENFQYGFKVTVFSKVGDRVGDKVGDEVGDALPITLTENQEKILSLLKEQPSLSARQLSSIIDLSQRKVEENVKKLKETGKLTRIGNNKKGHWRVME